MSECSGMVYSTTGVTSITGAVLINSHTEALYFLNLHATNNVTIKLNGGPHQVIIPPSEISGGYVEIKGDYTTFEVITTSITVAAYALS